MARHGGLAEIIRTRQTPGIVTSGNFDYANFQVPGVRPPKGGWKSRSELQSALKKAGRQGCLDSPAMHRYSKRIALTPPAGTILSGRQVRELQEMERKIK